MHIERPDLDELKARAYRGESTSVDAKTLLDYIDGLETKIECMELEMLEESDD